MYTLPKKLTQVVSASAQPPPAVHIPRASVNTNPPLRLWTVGPPQVLRRGDICTDPGPWCSRTGSDQARGVVASGRAHSCLSRSRGQERVQGSSPCPPAPARGRPAAAWLPERHQVGRHCGRSSRTRSLPDLAALNFRSGPYHFSLHIEHTGNARPVAAQEPPWPILTRPLRHVSTHPPPSARVVSALSRSATSVTLAGGLLFRMQASLPLQRDQEEKTRASRPRPPARQGYEIARWYSVPRTINGGMPVPLIRITCDAPSNYLIALAHQRTAVPIYLYGHYSLPSVQQRTVLTSSRGEYMQSTDRAASRCGPSPVSA